MQDFFEKTAILCFGLLIGSGVSCTSTPVQSINQRPESGQVVHELLRARQIELVAADGTVLGYLGARGADGRYGADLFLGRELPHNDWDGVKIDYVFAEDDPDDARTGLASIRISSPLLGGAADGDIEECLKLTRGGIDMWRRGSGKYVDEPSEICQINRDGIGAGGSNKPSFALKSWNHSAELLLQSNDVTAWRDNFLSVSAPLKGDTSPTIRAVHRKGNVDAQWPRAK